jgi:hypothetical protein
VKKIFIIGDSFCTKRIDEKQELIFWVDELKNELSQFKVICDGSPSRDAQTIIDNWIKIIPLINDNDFLMICLPHFGRTRLPLSEKNYRNFKDDNDLIYINRLIGTASFNHEYDNLEVWENNLKWHDFKKLLETQEMINGTNASIRNSIEVIESLIKITKGKKYIFSWDKMDIKSNYIEDKNDISNKLNMWETYGDVYNETNGLKGFNGDFHWSDKMNYQFSKYIINLINNG